MEYFTGKIKRQGAEIFIISLTITFYLFRTSVPFLKIPLFVLFSGLIVYSIITKSNRIVGSFIQFCIDQYLVLILVIILIISFLLSNKIFIAIFKDISNALVLIILFFILTLYINNKKELNLFIHILIRLIIFASLLLSLDILSNFLNIFQSHNVLTVNNPGPNPVLDAQSGDYNFASVLVLFGLGGVLYLLFYEDSFTGKLKYNSLLVIYSLSIILSGSRRALIILVCILIFLILIHFLAFMKSDLFRTIRSRTFVFLLSVITLFLFSWYFTFHTSYYSKVKMLEFIGTKDITLAKTKWALLAHKYALLLNKRTTFSSINDKIWLGGFGSASDPDSGWGSRIHKTIFPISGANAEIIPYGSKGYMLDKTSDYRIFNGNACSVTAIGNSQVKDGDIVMASVYCFVSQDFNGSSVQLFSEGATFGNTTAYYNITDSLSDENSGSSEYIDQATNLFNNGDFSDGTLSWLANADSTFLEIIKTPFGNGIRVSRTDGDGGWYSLMYNGRPIIYYAGHTYQIRFKYKVEKGKGVPFKIGWWVYDGKKGYVPNSLQLKTLKLKDGWNEAVCSYKFEDTHKNLPAFLNSLEDFSVVDIAKAEMVDLDRIESLPSFADQYEEMKLKKRGVWQKISIIAGCRDGSAPVFLYFSKYGVNDFSSLKGFVVFAYPQYKIIKKDSVLSLLKDFNRDENYYDIHQGSEKMSFAGFFTNTFSINTDHFTKVIKNVSMPKWISEFFLEDTTYFPYKSDLLTDTVSGESIGQRFGRWQFALQIYSKEFNWRQRITGGGFSFLNWYGYCFLKDKTKSDWPHNPFLSVLLYSGMIGLVLYIFLVFRVVYYYLKYLKEYYLLFVFFTIIFSFSFFSGSSPFDPPIVGFFILLPFFIHSIHKNDNQKVNEIIINHEDSDNRN